MNEDWKERRKRRMEAKTAARRERDLMELAAYLEAVGAYEGITHVGLAPVTLSALQGELDWSETRMRKVLDFAADNPELGIAIHIKRGRSREIVLSYDSVVTQATPRVRKMVAAEVHENFKRQIRTWCKALVRLKQADKDRTETLQFAWEIALQEKILRDVKFTLEMQDRERFAAEIEKIEAALAL